MVWLAMSAVANAGEILQFTDPQTGETHFTLKQGSTVAKLTSQGATVYSLSIEGAEYLFSRDASAQLKAPVFGIPPLYPTPNRLEKARFVHQGKLIQFTPNFGEHHIHGLVLDQSWHLVSKETGKDKVSVTLAIEFVKGSDLFKQFPFAHRLQLTISVSDKILAYHYVVDNLEGSEAVPFGFGLHPYFIYQGERENAYLTLKELEQMEAKQQFPTGKLVPAEQLDFPMGEAFAIGQRNFDDVFYRAGGAPPAIVDFRDTQRKITVRQSSDFTHMVLWTPDFPVLSVESQTASTNAANLHAQGHAQLAHWQLCPPGETRSGWVEYQFSTMDDFASHFDLPTVMLSIDQCSGCHGIVFTGGRAPSLVHNPMRHAKSEQELVAIIRDGMAGAGMPAFGKLLSGAQIENLANFLVEMKGSYPEKLARIAERNSESALHLSQYHPFRVENVVEGLNVPWSMALLPDGSWLVTERQGQLRRVKNGELGAPVANVPAVWARQDGGLLALTIDPDYVSNQWIYLAFADPGQVFGRSMTKLVRGRIVDNRWVDQQTLWQLPQSLYVENNSHYGTRLAFHKGHLYFAIGDRGQQESAQDLASPLGKIHRINPDGTVPADNPFVGRADAWPTVWSYGHRNPQGLVFNGDALWSTEHGPTGGDELNLIVRGANYGWPRVTGGINFDGSVISAHKFLPGMTSPVLMWEPPFAPSAITRYQGAAFSSWKNHFFVASLQGQELRRLKIESQQVVEQELLLKGLGRIRDVQTGADGAIYLAIEGFGGIGSMVKLVPAASAAP